MRRLFTKGAAMVLIIATLVSGFVGCGKKADTTGTNTGTAKETVKEVVKPTVINAIFDTTFPTPENGLKEFCEGFKAATGIELKVNQPAHNQYYEKVNLAFASGEVPDIVEMNAQTMETYATNGALLDITNLVNKSEVLKKCDQQYVNGVKVNGKVYGYPIQAGNGTVSYIRQDWLDKNSLKMPTTYDEFIKVLKVFADDPDKNGKKDTIAYTAPGLINTEAPLDIYPREFYQDASPDFIKKDGKWVDGMAQPEMKAALTRMVDAYKQGLIDKEVFTNKTSTCRDKFNAGTVGVFNYWAGSWNVTLETDLKKKVPDEKMVPMPALKETKYIERVPTVLAISAKCKNPEGIFKHIIEYMHDGDKGTLLFTHGVENIWYKKGADGKYVVQPALNDPKKLNYKAYIEEGLNIETTFNNPIPLDPVKVNSWKIYRSGMKMAAMLPASEAFAKYNPDVLASRTQIISKIVSGQMSLEDGLKKYTNDTKDAVDAILKDFNSAK